MVKQVGVPGMILKQGSKGQDVKRLQLALVNLHFLTKVDGIFGPATLRSVLRLQDLFGIKPDGIVGTVTWSKLYSGGQVSPHFNIFGDRLYCPRCGDLWLKRGVIVRLERVRELSGQPVIVISGCRDPVYNKSVGGAPESKHILGEAADWYIKGKTVKEMFQLSVAAGFLGIGRYKNSVHGDLGPYRRW